MVESHRFTIFPQPYFGLAPIFFLRLPTGGSGFRNP